MASYEDAKTLIEGDDELKKVYISLLKEQMRLDILETKARYTQIKKAMNTPDEEKKYKKSPVEDF